MHYNIPTFIPAINHPIFKHYYISYESIFIHK